MTHWKNTKRGRVKSSDKKFQTRQKSMHVVDDGAGADNPNV